MLESTLNRIKGAIVANGIASIILGILFLVFPVGSGFMLCYFVGALIFIAGIAKIVLAFKSKVDVAFPFVTGLLMVLLGLLCLFRPDSIASFLTILAGVYVVADGAAALTDGIAITRAKVGGGVFIIIMSVLLMICGLYIMFAPFTYIVLVAGIVLIVDGIFNLIFVGAMKRQIQEAKEIIEAKQVK